MENKGIISWLFNYAYTNLFESDPRRMAWELRMGEDALKRLLDKEHAEEAYLAFEQFAKYCIEHNISLDTLLSNYPDVTM